MNNLIAKVMARVGGSEASAYDRSEIIESLQQIDREMQIKDDGIKAFDALRKSFDKLAADYEDLRNGNLKTYTVFPTVGNTYPNKIQVIKALREARDMGLIEAKNSIDNGKVLLSPNQRELLHKIFMGRPCLNASVSWAEPTPKANEPTKCDDIPF